MNLNREHAAVLITAGTKRLGLELAKKALALGYDIAIHYRSDNREAETWLSENPVYRTRVTFLQKDISPDNAHELVENALSSTGTRLAGLVNNASLFTKGDLDDSGHFHSMLDSNTLVPLALSKAFKNRAGKGWIINITDAHIDSFSPAYQNYRISKHMLAELTGQLALLYAPGIRVNAIAPGALLPASGGTDFETLARTIPLCRTGDISSLTMAFEYLVLNEYVTGQVLYVDGGWHLCP